MSIVRAIARPVVGVLPTSVLWEGRNIRPGFRGPLDGLSTATKSALVHLGGGRRLLKTYPADGPIVRVRRSTDNAETDIGALKNGWIDAASAASFAGAGDLFVVSSYDQSGASRSLTQSTATAQPRLLISGGAASMVFDGNDHFERPATDWPTNLHTLSGVTVAARVSTPNPSLSAAVWSMRDNSTGFIAFGRNTAGTLYIFHTSDAGVSRSASSTVTLLPANQSVNLIAEWNFVTATARLWMDGLLIATLTGLDIAGGLTARRHWLGATRTTDIVARWTGPISTPVIVGNVLTEDERTLLNTTLGATP